MIRKSYKPMGDKKSQNVSKREDGIFYHSRVLFIWINYVFLLQTTFKHAVSQVRKNVILTRELPIWERSQHLIIPSKQSEIPEILYEIATSLLTLQQMGKKLNATVWQLSIALFQRQYWIERFLNEENKKVLKHDNQHWSFEKYEQRKRM